MSEWSKGDRTHECSIAMLILMLMRGMLGGVLNFVSALVHSSRCGGKRRS